MVRSASWVPISSGSTPKKIVNVFALAIRAGLSARDLKDMVYAYPTSASDIGYML